MLVLSRKAGERVVIGGGIEIVVLKSKNGQVRLGFNAPGDVPILRHEVVQRDLQAGGCLNELARLAPANL